MSKFTLVVHGRAAEIYVSSIERSNLPRVGEHIALGSTDERGLVSVKVTAVSHQNEVCEHRTAVFALAGYWSPNVIRILTENGFKSFSAEDDLSHSALIAEHGGLYR